uniref:(northern house mosquito) hypothetical protein n=1 Tax=Culex pipiens TaxID=7175 RepID=A0A8D8CTZ0_CULPI
MTAPEVISAPPHLYAKLPFATRSWTYTVHGNSPKLAIPSSRCSIPSSSSMKCTRLAIAARRWPHFFGFGATGRGLVVGATVLLVEEAVAAGAGVTSKMNSASGSSCRSWALNSCSREDISERRAKSGIEEPPGWEWLVVVPGVGSGRGVDTPGGWRGGG